MSEDRSIEVRVDGRQVRVPAGRSLAAVLMLDADQPAWRRTRFDGQSRGLFCGIGVCFDCLVSVDGGPEVRACLVPAVHGMQVQTRTSQTDDGEGEQQ